MIFQILDRQFNTLATMDNSLTGAIHFFNDEFHQYLAEGSSTYTFSVLRNHADTQYLIEGNYLQFTYKSRDYLMTIRRIEADEYQLDITCEDLCFDLINEYTPAYTATKARKITEYLADVLVDSDVVIGRNEVASYTRKLEWTGESTVLARVLSIANYFDAEVEFVTELENDRSLKQITLNIYHKYDAKHQGVGVDRTDIELRFGENVKTVKKTTDITELYTCIKPVGKDGLSIKDIEETIKDDYGNVQYYTKKGSQYIYAPQSNDRFGRKNSEKGGYINMPYEYDTASVATLYGNALAQLKKYSEPAVTYEVEGYYDLNVGDVVSIADNGYSPMLLLEARVSEMIISFCNPEQNTTVFTNYRVFDSQISSDLLDMMEKLKDDVDYAVQVANTPILKISVNGSTVFKNGEGTVTLQASIEKAMTDITDEYTVFNWKKNNKDGSLDEEWTAAHKNHGKVLTVTPDDFDDAAVFSYEVETEDKVLLGGAASLVKLYDGEDGKTPVKGSDYFDGVDGQDGRSAYLHIRYSQNANGTPMTDDPVGAVYVGMLVSQNPTPSTVPADYDWTLVKGADGIAGETGADGRTSYLHIKYSDDGGKTLTANNGETVGQWLGQYVDFTQADSTDVSKYAWSKIKGDTGERGVAGAQGPKGDQGIAGPKGADGQTQYTHIAYANSADGTVDFSVSDADRKYIGMYVDFTATDSTTPSDYAWTLVKGADGAQGTAGKAGADGKTPYFHTAWANSADGKTGFSTTVSAGKTYLGTYTDYTQADSTDPTKYAWSLIKGDKGDTGPKGDKGDDGVAGKDGVGLKSTAIQYAQSTSGTTAPTTGWATNVPTLVKGQYLWTKTVWTYTDNNSETGYTVSYNAKDGNTGKDGIAGKDGVGISNTVIEYVGAVSGTSKPTSGWSTTIPTVPQGQYLWTRTTWTYTDGTTEQGYSTALMGPKGDKGDTGDDGQTPVVHPAWSWSADGTDRLTTVYPGENLQPNSTGSSVVGYDYWSSNGFEISTNGEWINVKVKNLSDPNGVQFPPLTFEKGITYTISLDVKALTNFTANYCYLMGSSGNIKLADVDVSGSEDWVRVTIKATPVYNTEYRVMFGWRRDELSKNTDVGIKNIKVEKGDTPTIYTPSPSEDYANAYPLYEGTYTDYSETASQNPADYTWRRIIGESGQDGVAGADGKGIKSTAVTYQASTSGTVAPTGTWVANPPTVAKGQYLWTRTIWTYTDNATETGYSVAYVAKDGNDGSDGIAGKDGVGIKSTAITYAVSSSGTTAPTSGWVASPPTATAGQFMWTKTVWTYTDNTTETGYSVGKIGDTGANGKDGEDGSNGISVTETAEEYYVSTSGTTQTGGSWSTVVPNNANPNLYVWRRTKTTFSNGNVTYTTPALIQGMTGIYPYIGPTQPANPKEGQQWWKSDSNGNVTDFYVYHDGSWQGQTIQQSVLNIVALNAVNITGSSIVGTTISGSTITGSEFVNTFDFLKGFDYYLRGDTTIKDAGIVINAESYQDGNVFYNQRLEYSANVGGLYVQETSPTSQLGERWVLMTPTGIGMYDGRYASTYGRVNLKYQDLMTLPTVGIPAASGWTQYNTSGTSWPTATRNGRVVQLAGAFKNANVLPKEATAVMGTLPVGYRPKMDVNVLVQGSMGHIYLLNVKTNGQLGAERYRRGYDYVDAVAGSWFNIACTYAAGDI